jgi:hypothetical protein
LEPCEIGLLFADSIIELFKGAPSVPLRIRGDYDKLITLVKMRACWHQKQRPWTGSGKKKIIFALPEDLVETLKYAKATILEMTSGLEKRLTDALPTVYALKSGVVHVGQEMFTGFTIEDFRRKYCPRSSYNTAVRILDGLANAGVLSYRKERGLKIFEVLITQAEAKNLNVDVAKNEMAGQIQAIAEKEFEEKFLRLCQVATEPIHVTRKMLELLPSLQSLFKKSKEGSMVIDEAETDPQVSNLCTEGEELLAYVANRQSSEYKENNPESDSENANVAKDEKASLGD